MSREKCNWITGITSSFLMGKQVKYDVSTLVADLVEITEGGYRCKLCNTKHKLNMLILHLRRKHCAELVELWSRVRPKRLYESPGGRPVFTKIVVQCKGCGCIQLLEPYSNRGPPHIKLYLMELQSLGALRKCPKCGRTLDPSIAQLKFVGEREVVVYEDRG